MSLRLRPSRPRPHPLYKALMALGLITAGAVALTLFAWQFRTLIPLDWRKMVKAEIEMRRPPLSDLEIDSQPWNGTWHVVAHQGGGRPEHAGNTLEALETSYALGLRWFELDFERTIDGHYVVLHDWASAATNMFGSPGMRSLEQFRNHQRPDGRTQLSLDEALVWFADRPEARLITDCKTDNPYFLELLLRRAQRIGVDVEQQIVPQTYRFTEYGQALQLGYARVILTLYRVGYVNRSVLRFAERWQPFLIVLPASRVGLGLPAALDSLDVPTFAHTVNDPETAARIERLGIDGIYSDTLIEFLGGSQAGVIQSPREQDH